MTKWAWRLTRPGRWPAKRPTATKKDLSICDQADHPGVKYQCYYLYTQHAGDPAARERIPDLDLGDGCYSDLAASKNDPEICQRIAGQGVKDSCYFRIAKGRADRTLCDRIEDQGLRSGCMRESVTID